MSFASWAFVWLFVVVFAAVHLLGPRRLRAQNAVLLGASYVFYGWWDARFLGLLAASSLVDYACALGVDRGRRPGRSERARRAILGVSVAFNVGVLGVFKYFDFFAQSAAVALEAVGLAADLPTLGVILPVGISFYTFQTLSYTIDVYRGELRATRRLDEVLLYVSFFPQLVAGPIERGARLLPQLTRARVVTKGRVVSGALLALVGYAKKRVVADGLAPLVDATYGASEPSGAALVLATYAFAIQIYADFSGYTDIARGVARMVGVELGINFRRPYLAQDPSAFWRRWHVSLSSWLRDYVYVPLGGNRHRTLRNLVVVMLLGGLWHGAAWTFVLWGAFHGVVLVAYRGSGGTARGWVGAARALVFFHVVCAGWLLFRAPDLAFVVEALRTWAVGPWWPEGGASALAGGVWRLGVLTAPLVVGHWLGERGGEDEPWARWGVLGKAALGVGLVVALGSWSAEAGRVFIYFQF